MVKVVIKNAQYRIKMFKVEGEGSRPGMKPIVNIAWPTADLCNLFWLRKEYKIMDNILYKRYSFLFSLQIG